MVQQLALLCQHGLRGRSIRGPTENHQLHRSRVAHTAGFMQEFFAKTGNHKLRFKPAYNPYTEPSMEVFSWHEGLGKWIEIANVSPPLLPP